MPLQWKEPTFSWVMETTDGVYYAETVSPGNQYWWNLYFRGRRIETNLAKAAVRWAAEEHHNQRTKMDHAATSPLAPQGRIPLPKAPLPSKYHRRFGNEVLDVYDVLTMWNVTCPATQHAIKKLLAAGQRGHKSKKQDLDEALQSIQRAVMLSERHDLGS